MSVFAWQTFPIHEKFAKGNSPCRSNSTAKPHAAARPTQMMSSSHPMLDFRMRWAGVYEGADNDAFRRCRAALKYAKWVELTQETAREATHSVAVDPGRASMWAEVYRFAVLQSIEAAVVEVDQWIDEILARLVVVRHHMQHWHAIVSEAQQGTRESRYFMKRQEHHRMEEELAVQEFAEAARRRMHLLDQRWDVQKQTDAESLDEAKLVVEFLDEAKFKAEADRWGSSTATAHADSCEEEDSCNDEDMGEGDGTPWREQNEEDLYTEEDEEDV